MHHTGSTSRYNFPICCSACRNHLHLEKILCYWSIGTGSDLIDCKSFAGRQVAFLQSSPKSSWSSSKHLKNSLLIPLAIRPVAGLVKLHRWYVQALSNMGKKIFHAFTLQVSFLSGGQVAAWNLGMFSVQSISDIPCRIQWQEGVEII